MNTRAGGWKQQQCTVAGLALSWLAYVGWLGWLAYERRWVQIAMAMVEGMRIGDNFLFHHTSDALHDEVLHSASVIAVLMLVSADRALAWFVRFVELRSWPAWPV